MEFAFQPELQTLDIVPENCRVFYAQNAETKVWGLRDSAEVKGAVSIISGQNAALKKIRGELKIAADGRVDLSPLSEFGDNPLSIAEAFKTKITEAQGAASGDIERQAAKIKESLEKEYGKRGEASGLRIKALETQLFTLMGTGEAKKALGEVGAIDVDLALPFVNERLKTVEENGEFAVRVMDAQGDLSYSGITGKPKTVTELVKEMKGNPKFGPLFKSDTPQGGGPTPGAPSGKAPPKGEPAKSPTDKIAAGLKAGMHQGARAEGAANARHQG